MLGQAGKGLDGLRAAGLGLANRHGTLASFPAREVIVGTLGIIYNQGDVDPKEIREADNASETPLGKAIKKEWTAEGRFKHPKLVALSLLVFLRTCCQCVSTLAVIRRETHSWSWPIFTFVYMTALAYLGALATFQIGSLILG